MGENNGLKFAGAPAKGQPVQPSSKPAEETPASEEPKYLTVEQFNQMAETLKKDLQANAQGLIDKNSHRIEAKVQGQLAELTRAIAIQRKAGINITPEQEKLLKQEIINSAFEPVQDQNQASQQQAAPPAPAGEPEIHPAVKAALAYMKKAGVQIEDVDPEVELIDQATTDEGVFLASVMEAVQTKKARIQQEENRASPESRIPSLGKGAPKGGFDPNMDSSAYFREGYKKNKKG